MDLADSGKLGSRTRAGSYAFGGFVLDPLRRCVWRADGSRITFAPRAFSALQIFVEHPGELLFKDWLIAVLWPGAVVDENNLSQVISTLRRELGDSGRQFIQTEARRGFRFICPVTLQPSVAREPGLPSASQKDSMPPVLANGGSRGPKLAVLPFINLDDDPGQDYFVAGMMEEIVAALTRVRSLFVIASNTTMALTGDALLPEVAARRLGVHYILEGSVRRAGRRVRITVKLTDGIDNVQIWSERFEGSLEDIFALQDKVALGVAGIIEPSIRDLEARRVARTPPDNMGSYDLYLRAAHLRARLRKDAAFESLALLDRALQLDPEFAPALAHAAGCHSQILVSGWSADPEYHRHAGHALVNRALNACGDDASVLAQTANALMDLELEPGNNIDRALGLITRATELNPGSAFAWFISGVLNLINGNGGAAVNHLQRAMRLDPVSPLHEVAKAHVGLGIAQQGRYCEAAGMLRAANNLTARAQLVLACVSSQLGELSQAREDLQRYEQMTSVPAEAMVMRMVRHPPSRSMMFDSLVCIRSNQAGLPPR